MSDAPIDEPSQADIDAVTGALRASAPATSEPDWSALAADIGRAVDDEARRSSRRRRLMMGGVVLAAAAVAAILVWPRGGDQRATTSLERDAAVVRDAADGQKLEAAVAELLEAVDTLGEDAIASPDDFGSLTIDEDLADTEAAALDDTMDDAVDDLDDRLLPDSAWIDDLSDDDLERVVEILDKEAG